VGLAHQWEFQDPKMEVLYHIRPVRTFHFFGLTFFFRRFFIFFGLFLNLLDFVCHVLACFGTFWIFWNVLEFSGCVWNVLPFFGMFCFFF